MLLDVPALLIVSIFVTTILGLVLLLAWARDRSIRALAWWGVACLIGSTSVGIYLVQDSLSDALSLAIGNAMLFAACGVIWSGARLFHGRKVKPVWMFAGAIAWLTALTIPGFTASPIATVVFSSLAISAYTLLTCFEFWGGRRERLKAGGWNRLVLAGADEERVFQLRNGALTTDVLVVSAKTATLAPNGLDEAISVARVSRGSPIVPASTRESSPAR
jgi:hypothetical protein